MAAKPNAIRRGDRVRENLQLTWIKRQIWSVGLRPIRSGVRVLAIRGGNCP